MYALDGPHYLVTEQLTHRFIHSFCGNVVCGGGNNPEMLILAGVLQWDRPTRSDTNLTMTNH